MFLRQGKEWCVQLQLLEPRKATKHWSVCALPTSQFVSASWKRSCLQPMARAADMCMGWQPVGCPTGVAAAFFDSWSSVGMEQTMTLGFINHSRFPLSRLCRKPLWFSGKLSISRGWGVRAIPLSSSCATHALDTTRSSVLILVHV